jgi:hypothetical protein
MRVPQREPGLLGSPPLRATWAATHPPIGERPSLRTPLPPPPEGLAGPPCGPQGRRRGAFLSVVAPLWGGGVGYLALAGHDGDCGEAAELGPPRPDPASPGPDLWRAAVGGP